MKPMFEIRPSELSVDLLHQTSFPEHLHPQVEIIMPLSGSSFAMVDGTEHIVHPDEALFVFPNHIHAYTHQTDAHILMTIFSPALLPTCNVDWESMQPVSPLIQKLGSDAQYAKQRLIDSVSQQLPVRDMLPYVHLLAAGLLSGLTLETADKPVVSDILYSALKYISEHFTNDITLHKVARSIGASEYYLSHLMNTRLKTDFRKYVNLLRIDLARQLLLQKSLPVEEVAFRCGFTNLRSFDRVFGQVCNCSPREYRRQLINAAIAENM